MNSQIIENYINEVRKYIPEILLDENQLQDLRLDLQEAGKDGTSPVDSMGNSKDTARNIISEKVNDFQSATWFHRIAAFSIDGALIGIIILLSTVFFYWYADLDWTNEPQEPELTIPQIIVVSIICILLLIFIVTYFIWAEKEFNTTLGKRLLGLYTISKDGLKLTWSQSLIRNLTKIQGEFLPFDVLIGWYLKKDPNYTQKVTDYITECIVIKI